MRRYFVVMVLLLSGVLVVPWLDPPVASRPAAPGPLDGSPWPHIMYLPLVDRKPAGVCTELLSNGGFENGGSAWIAPGLHAQPVYVDGVAHSGLRSVRLGLVAGQPVTGDGPVRSYIYQTVDVPWSDGVILSFAYNAGTNAPGDLAAGSDLQQAMILDAYTGHTMLEELTRSFDNDSAWHLLVFDASAYRGRSIDVAFAVVNNTVEDEGRTWLYIDDVSLQSCLIPSPTPTATLTATPTPQPSATATAGPTSTPTMLPLTPTATGTVTPAPTATATATRTTVPTPTLIPGCTELLLNGSFEEDAAWIFWASTSQGYYTALNWHSGYRSAFLGLQPAQGRLGPSSTTDSTVYQTVTIPPGSGVASLTVWYYPATDDPYGSDYQRFLVLDSRSHDILAELLRVHENDRAWKSVTFDMAPYRGAQIDVAFQVHNNSTGPTGRTWTFVDDASLTLCP